MSRRAPVRRPLAESALPGWPWGQRVSRLFPSGANRMAPANPTPKPSRRPIANCMLSSPYAFFGRVSRTNTETKRRAPA